MIQTEHVMQWLKTLSAKATNYYCGFLDAKKEKSFGVYPLNDRRKYNMAIGGRATTKADETGISVLVHWNKNSRESEKVACALHKAIAEAAMFPLCQITRLEMYYIAPVHDAPIPVGQDENGIFEWVIEFRLHHERA